MATNPTILLDLDCCLADFVGGAATAHGLDLDRLMASWPAGTYGMEFAMRALAGDPHPGGKPTHAGKFWDVIGTTPGFWRNLPKLPWADDLFLLAAQAAGCGKAGVNLVSWGRLYVVTSPSRCPGCIREKEDWLHHHYGLPHDRMIPTPHKELMAVTKDGPAILIDDYDANCDKFVAAGGRAVLFPAHHNSRHEFKADPVAVVRTHLARLTEGY